jgi:citrate synthase
MSSVTTTLGAKGLEGIVATNSSICYIDGDRGVLAYRGIDIHELADHSNFEETCYLLWFGRLPNRNELATLREQLAQERRIDPAIIEFLRTIPKSALPMDVLRTAVSALAFYDADDKKNDHDANIRKAIRLTSQIAMIVAAYDRIRKGQPVVEADRSLSHAANFLLQLNGTKPSATAERALDIALILHADHELNASTFAARVTAATLSDMHSAITSAIGALKGPLHGGANEAVFRILNAIAEKRTRGLRARHAGAEKESSRLRPSRLPHGRSARHASAKDVQGSLPIQRAAAVVRHVRKD